MLDNFRRHVKGWLGKVIVAGISLTFALFGLQSYTAGGSEKPVATVGDYEIYQGEVNVAYQRQVEELKEQYGDQYSPESFSEEMVRQQALHRLVQDKLILHTVDQDGYEVSEKSVLHTIGKIDAFQQDGQFNKDLFNMFLQSRGMTSNQFAAQIKAGIEKEQFINSIIDSVMIDDSQINNFYRLNNQTRDFRYLSVLMAPIFEKMELTEEEVQAFYSKNEHLYKQPEQASIEYVELSLDRLTNDVNATEEELLGFYETEQQLFTVLGRRKASHILFEVPEGSTIEASEQKRLLAEEVLQKAKSGEDFAALAKTYSDDIGSAKEGGDLGIITEGMMGDRFEETLSALQEGEVSEVVQTEYGFQIIKLTEQEPALVKPFAEIRDKVASLYKTQIASEKLYQMSERYAELGFENPETLQPLVDELGLKIEQYGPLVEATGTGIAAHDKVRHAAFNKDVLAGNNSEVLELAKDHYVVLRVTEHQAESTLPLEQVKAAVEIAVKTEKASVLLEEKTQALLAELEAGKRLKDLTVEGEVVLTDVGPVRRSDRNAPETIMRDAFSMSHPTDDKPAYKQSVLPTGDFAVIELQKIVDGDVADLQEANRTSYRKLLERLNGEVSLAAALANLSVGADVKLPSDLGE